MKAKLIISAITSAMLVACGGSGPDPVPGAGSLPISLSSNLVTTVPAPTYSPALETEELASFNLLNAERTTCGFGKLTQNASLDAAALNHATWALVNNFTGHFQVAGTPGFTGVNPDTRMVAAGYETNTGAFKSSDEISSILGSSAKSGFGSTAIRSLMNAPYHMNGLLGSYRDIGISVRNDADAGSAHGPRVVAQLDVANKLVDGAQLMGSADVETYPCAGSSGVNRLLNNESPNPVPGRDLAASPLGSTVYIAVREGRTLVITGAIMTKISNGAVVTLRSPVTSTNDVHGIYRAHQGFVSADAPLDAGSAYSVSITGTSDGEAFTKSFTFTTGF